MIVDAGGVICVSEETAIMCSRDDGSTWTALPLDREQGQVGVLALTPNNHLVVGTLGGGAFRRDVTVGDLP